jgi:hypothetical protein
MATAPTLLAPPESPEVTAGAAEYRYSPQWQTLRLFGGGRHATFEAGSERKGDL